MSSNFPSGLGHTGKSGSVLVKAPQDPPPSKLFKKLGILEQQIFCTVLRGGFPPSKVCKNLSTILLYSTGVASTQNTTDSIEML